jgi:glycosyltransferase involved in cell wall biosynthesis
LESVIKARSKGIVSVCDHSIAHPEICEYLIKNNGQLPDVKEIININAYWKNMLDDINNADHCIVNSDFVKKTFINRNYDPNKVHVVYTGIDNDFLNVVPKKILNTSNKKLNLIFIGEFGYRKGADILLEALANVNNIDWKITIVGRVDPSILLKYNKILFSNRVLMVGFLPRLELADLLSKSDIFIFPTLAEGSARVAYMAMACGCYIITTENCGSVAVDKMSGSIVTPGSVIHLVDAIAYCSNLSKIDLFSVGEFNSDLIRNKYTQNHYGNSLFRVYKDILGG